MRIPVIIISLLISTTVSSQKINQPLADTLRIMVITDQQAAGLPPEVNGEHPFTPQWMAFKDSVFSSHHNRLEKIFAQHGYPGQHQVGIEGSHHFWLLVQHLDKWPDFQLAVLKAMKIELDKHNADGKDFAFLTDRVGLNTAAKKQVYGTQVTYNLDSCQAYPRPLEDPAGVNDRRKQAGLEPLEEYLNFMSKNHYLMNREVYEKKGLKGPKLYPVTN